MHFKLNLLKIYHAFKDKTTRHSIFNTYFCLNGLKETNKIWAEVNRCLKYCKISKYRNTTHS